jgi:hypothetical protein
VFTRLVKVPAHKAHPLNEAADAAASQAAEEGDAETATLCHADSGAVRFYLRGRLTEWRADVRKALAEVETSHHQALLTARLERQAASDDPGADLTEDRRGGRAVSLTAQWLLRREREGGWGGERRRPCQPIGSAARSCRGSGEAVIRYTCISSARA